MKAKRNILLAAIACLGASFAQAAPYVPSVTVSPTAPAAWPYAFNLASTSAPNTFTNNEGNYSGSAATPSLAQSFLATTSGKLDSIQFLGTGTGGATYNLHVYDTGVWDLGQNSTSDWGDVTDSAGSGGNHTYVPGGAGTGAVSADLLGANAAGITYTTGDTYAVNRIDLLGTDEITITSGHFYIVEIQSPTPAANMLLVRNGSTPTYADGQAFRGHDPLNGATRDFAIALNVVPVPEPTALALLGVGAAGLLRRRKH